MKHAKHHLIPHIFVLRAYPALCRLYYVNLTVQNSLCKGLLRIKACLSASIPPRRRTASEDGVSREESPIAHRTQAHATAASAAGFCESCHDAALDSTALPRPSANQRARGASPCAASRTGNFLCGDVDFRVLKSTEDTQRLRVQQPKHSAWIVAGAWFSGAGLHMFKRVTC